jgi:hypothetical protein
MRQVLVWFAAVQSSSAALSSSSGSQDSNDRETSDVSAAPAHITFSDTSSEHHRIALPLEIEGEARGVGADARCDEESKHVDQVEGTPEISDASLPARQWSHTECHMNVRFHHELSLSLWCCYLSHPTLPRVSVSGPGCAVRRLLGEFAFLHPFACLRTLAPRNFLVCLRTLHS